MADISLTQSEADALIAMEKHRADEDHYDFPWKGESLILSLQSTDKREQFLLDVSRSRIDLLKGKFQNRGRQVIILIRLDFGGAPHRNPDGEEVDCPHLHLYREGFGDKWAIPVPDELSGKYADMFDRLVDFMKYCNITKPPKIERGLFI